MKWIKSRDRYLNEAKIKDVILPRQAKEVASEWSEKYLEYEEVEPTNKIKQGKWKLSEEDKNKVLNAFFDTNLEEVFGVFKNLDDKFADVLKDSIDTSLFKGGDKEKYETILKDFNPKNPTIDQITLIYEPVFRKLSINETKGEEYVMKDDDGRPVKDEEGKIVKAKKEKGAPMFEKNLVNIRTFVDSYNRCYEDSRVDSDDFYKRSINNLINLSSENHNTSYKIDFEIFNRDLYLSIKHSARDILNMSISKFYSSCQHLYSGGYRGQLLGNVFDPNSIPAFLIFDTPIFWKDEIISDFLPLSRMMIRNIETFDENNETKLFFDRAYPDRMKDVFDEIVPKYSDNIMDDSFNSRYPEYLFTPDVDMEDNIRQPYMDKLGIKKLPYIGVNTKSLNLNRNYDWSKVKISPKAKIKEIVIETNELPENLFKLSLNPDWVKFKYIKINNLESFKSLVTDSIAFDKCKFSNDTINQLPNSDKIEKLQFISCDVVGGIKLTNFTNLKELHLIYTLDEFKDLQAIISDLTSLNKLVISGDLMTPDAKKYINGLKSKGLKIETVGPVL